MSVGPMLVLPILTALYQLPSHYGVVINYIEGVWVGMVIYVAGIGVIFRNGLFILTILFDALFE